MILKPNHTYIVVLTFSTWNLSSPGSRRGQDVDYAHKYKIIFSIQPRAWSWELRGRRCGWEARLRYCACLGRHVSDDSLKVKVRVGHFYKEKKLINCSTLKSERSHKCKINLQLVKDSNIKRWMMWWYALARFVLIAQMFRSPTANKHRLTCLCCAVLCWAGVANFTGDWVW